MIGLHQSGNIVYSWMQGMMDITNTTDTKKRIGFGILSELILWLVIVLALPLAQSA